MDPNDEAFDELKNTRKRRRIGDRVIHMFVFHARHLFVTYTELMNHLNAHIELALWPESTLQQVMCPTSQLILPGGTEMHMVRDSSWLHASGIQVGLREMKQR